MSHPLKQLYWMLVLPVAAGFLVLTLLDGAGLLLFNAGALNKVLAPALFTMAALFSIGLPVLYRSALAHRLRQHRDVSQPVFLRFQRHLICIAMVTPYLALMAWTFKLSAFHCSGIVLMALYAGYYFYPSKKRIVFEKKLFRVLPPSTPA